SGLKAEWVFTDNKNITIAFTGSGFATVTSTPSGITAAYNNGTTTGTQTISVGNTAQVTLTASNLTSGTSVTSWTLPGGYGVVSGCGAGNSTCTFTLNNNPGTITLGLALPCTTPQAPTS